MWFNGFKNLNILDLIPTQDVVRCDKYLKGMIYHVESGGKFTLKTIKKWHRLIFPRQAPAKIAITRFEDGKLYIRDGHHRIAAMFLGGRKYVHWSEYYIEEMTYAMYMDLNPAAGWFTPFDPRTQVRIYKEFDRYRQNAMKIRFSGKLFRRYVEINQSMYKKTRPITHSNILGLIDNEGIKDNHEN